MADDDVVEDDCQTEIGYYRGSVDRLLLAIDGAGLEGATLVIDAFDADDVAPFVEERTTHRPDLRAKNRKATEAKFKFLGVYFYAGHDLFLPIEGSNVRDLAALTDLLHAVRVEDESGYCLVDAPDIGDNEIFVNDRTPDSVRRALREALGDDLSAPDP
jgi:hypothetical protein